MIQAAPFTSVLIMIGALALVGSPPFNIFISKFSIFTAGIASGYVWLMIVCLLFLAIVFAAFMRFISSAVFGELPENIHRGEVKASMLAPIVVLVILILTLGLYLPPQYSALLNQATQIAGANLQVASAPGGLFVDGTALPMGILQVARFLRP